MKLLENETELASLEACAALMMDVVPLVMRTIRTEMRSHRSPDLSVAQFRALLYINRHAGTSLSALAEHLGLSLPSTSKLVDKLLTRALITRESDPVDRRRVTLALTGQGQDTLSVAANAARTRLAQDLAALSPDERATVAGALTLLRAVFNPESSTSR
ncbi:MarR family winged helix-turn-helix transcriptional regulator [Aggregatilinea lenta]|uniref:MarR family winged helix-turn-helix transcriptional regulator n=1 Tax=Aggregatilinea lenta TaxID=913108 RepID=UPI000E5A691B|nr:MarR family transcriptional regulator [Aggregatilinea lenta]